MNIVTDKIGNELTISLEGRLDTLTSPEHEKKLESELDGIDKLTFDLKGLKYISSAGLRVLAGAMDIMEDQGEMFVTNVCDDVRDVFEITGFIEDLNMI